MHEAIRESLWLSLSKDRVFHAIIFEGPSGIGKRTLGREFAMALHCEGDVKPCGKCHACIKHKTGNHPDYIEVTPEKDKKAISVKVIREAVEDLYIKPLISDRKVIFIPEADLCEKAAQNAMLKCFEEPPAYATIILAVQNLSALLETIKSRAVIYSLNPSSNDEIKRFIESEYSEYSHKADFIAGVSEGIVGRAKNLIENGELLKKREELLNLLKNLDKSRLSALKVADYILENIDDEEFLFSSCLSFVRDIAALKHGATNLINSDFYEKIENLAKSVSKKASAKALYQLSNAKCEKSKYANYSLWITDVMIALWEALHG